MCSMLCIMGCSKSYNVFISKSFLFFVIYVQILLGMDFMVMSLQKVKNIAG